MGFGPFEHHQQFALVGALAGQQTIERGEAGLVAEDIRSNRADKTALRAGEGIVDKTLVLELARRSECVGRRAVRTVLQTNGSGKTRMGFVRIENDSGSASTSRRFSPRQGLVELAPQSNKREDLPGFGAEFMAKVATIGVGASAAVRLAIFRSVRRNTANRPSIELAAPAADIAHLV